MLNKKAKIIIISHVGRPGGKINPELSMKPICENLEEKINEKINLITDDEKLTDKDLFSKFKSRCFNFRKYQDFTQKKRIMI